MGKEDMLLYWGSGSPPCVRVMIALEEKGFGGYPNKQLEFSKGEHKGADVLALNPRGQVPTFKDGGVVINESCAVLHYLQHRYPDAGTNLIPGTPDQQGLVLQRFHEIFSNVGMGYLTLFRGIVFDKAPEDITMKRKDKFVEELATMEKYLSESEFVAGDTFSLADVELITTLIMCERQGLPMEERFPKMLAYYGRMSARPSVVASFPPHFRTSESGKVFAKF